jgi:hypothetical protein
MPMIQEIFEIALGHIGFVLVVPDGTIDFVIAQDSFMSLTKLK